MIVQAGEHCAATGLIHSPHHRIMSKAQAVINRAHTGASTIRRGFIIFLPSIVFPLDHGAPPGHKDTHGLRKR
jgi:UDP-N-acetylglucosamine:LPS N-acetylglucosamine transferase